MKKIINTRKLFFFLRQPKLYPELLRQTQRKVNSLLFPNSTNHTAQARAKVHEEATEYYQAYALDTKEAIFRITQSKDFVSFYQKFDKELIEARQIVNQCPISMGGEGNLELIYQLAQYVKAKKVIETGVAYGWSSLAFLLFLKNQPDSLLVSTDLPYFVKGSEKYVGCVVPTKLKSHWKLIKAPDRLAIPQALKLVPKADLVHYDSDKFYEGRMWAYPLLWNNLRPGGIFISDDINNDFGFRDFSNSLEQEPFIVQTPTSSKDEYKYVGILIKPNEG